MFGFARVFEEGTWHARHAGESGEREHVHLITVLVVSHDFVPDFAGARIAWDEDHGTAMAGDFDLKRRLGKQAAGEGEGEE